MYPSTSSSSSQKPTGPLPTGLTRYGSAPGSLLATAVDSVIGAEREFNALRSPPPPPPPLVGQYFSGDSSSITSESNCKVNSSLHRSSHGLNEIAARIGSSSSSSSSSASPSSSLLRQRSSPAGFLSHLSNVVTDKNGFSVTRGNGGYGSQGGTNSGHGVSRLTSQLSFTRQDCLSQISEVSENGIDDLSPENVRHSATHSFATSFGMDGWDNNTNSIVFSAPPSKRAKNMDGDMFNCLNALESQFSLPQTTLEMAAVEKLLHIPEDSVPCKIRAKRGCATHPRSIAERERRTRISGKLKKLQDLVPNMDKQTSYADMLDLAVQHIKGLQNQVQKLHKDLENCTCGCKQNT
ncbi:Basic helix-loop-helix transcription factor [Trema orientale]|uniref:Basic helix-loop-helix transcription factor n=1 Tax=Trema orientale TaxID=63057 RepID=A0A2P5FCM9_TREOI|nr:Basic helix-loop-helix transcription factor [Trema orientale]